MQVNVYEAKTQLSRLLDAAERGEEVVIARAGRPVARLVPIAATRRRTPGTSRGQWKLAEDWDSPQTNAEVAATFEASHHLLPSAEPTRPARPE
jgi:prevent-host-death family protein